MLRRDGQQHRDRHHFLTQENLIHLIHRIHRDRHHFRRDCHTHLHEHQSYGCGIVEFATSHDAALIVFGALGTSNLRDMLLGSTAERVFRETPCSVLAIRAGQGSGQEG